jgi:F-type H+-transporting ATPase subunit c
MKQLAREQPTPGPLNLSSAKKSSVKRSTNFDHFAQCEQTLAGVRIMIDVLAQTALLGDHGVAVLGAAIGAGLTVLGGAKGIGHLAGQAMEGIARQPEAGGRIGTNMIIAAALIEGFTFFALVIVLLLWLRIQPF